MAGTGNYEVYSPSQPTVARRIEDLPGPRRLPILGNAHQIPITEFYRTLEEWRVRYGPIFRFDLGARRVVCVGDATAINAILRDRPDNFQRWREQREMGDEVGLSGVSMAEGDDWRRQRRLVITAFNSNQLQRYFDVVRRATERLQKRLAVAAQHGRPVDITWQLKSFSADVVCALALGHDLNAIEHPDNELLHHVERISQMLGRRVRCPIPYWHWIKLPADRALDRSVADLRATALTFIEHARKCMAETPGLWGRPENLLQGMLAAQAADSSITDEEIVSNALSVLHAGKDTTAYTLAWTLWFLASYPDIERRWRAEADEVLGDDLVPQEYETVEQFRYGDAVLRESTRLQPVVINPFLVEPKSDVTISCTQIPAGTRLFLLHRSAGMRSGSVARAGEFDPTRWLSESDERPDIRAVLSFGAGPRFCPGRNLALLESKAALAMIARNFEFEVDESEGPVTERLVAMVKPNGLYLRLKHRHQSE